MAKTVQASNTTPYKNAREEAGIRQWQAVELLPSSKSSLNRYELGKLEPPGEVVARMDHVYGCKGKLLDSWAKQFKFSLQNKKTALTVIKTALKKIINLFSL